LNLNLKKMKTRQIVLASRPKGLPTQENFRFEETEVKDLKDGEVLLKAMYFSVDPYMRGRMNEGESYSPPFEINSPIMGGVVSNVAESMSDKYKKGDIVLGNLPWSELCVATEKDIHKIEASSVHTSYYLGVLGMTGMTAYLGLMKIGKPEKGETVVVSGAAGAVGMVVGQIAKIQGCHVVGLAGTDEKVKSLKTTYGFDEAINYKTTKDLPKALAEACPKGVDVYFDNVGGEISDAVIRKINFHGRIIVCGQIALYNSTDVPMGPRIQPIILTKSVLMQGFIIGNYQNYFLESTKQIAKWLAEGKIKYTDTIVHGFENIPKAFIGLFSGENTGKMVVEV
jgi:NADPH:quinone reductase